MSAAKISASQALGVLRSPSFGAMLGLGTVLLMLFVVWVAAAQAIYVATFGYAPAAGIPDFLSRILTTGQGWMLIIVGCGVGFLFALAALCIRRGLVPDDAGPARQRHRFRPDLASGGCGQSGGNGGVGVDRRRAPDRRLDPGLPRACRGRPGAGTRDLAPLPQGGGAQSNPYEDLPRLAPWPRAMRRTLPILIPWSREKNRS